MSSENTVVSREEERLSRRTMEARRQIRVIGDPVLRDRAVLVERFDRQVRRLAERMIGIMQDAPGIGLAAPQVGVMQRMLVYEVDDGPKALVNPVLGDPSVDTEVTDEGCLSIPGVVVPVERPASVRVQARDERGREVDFRAEGLEARVIQHETDHLDGMLIIDRTTREARAAAMRALRENGDALAARAGSGGL
jgi:peptide deformylase